MDDKEQLDILGVLFYVFGGLACVFSLMFLLHVVMGIFMISGMAETAEGQGDEAFVKFMGAMFLVIGLGGLVLGETLGVLSIKTGRSLRARTRYRLCFVTACCACVVMPLGTVLGVFTLIALSREGVKGQFAGG